MTESPSTAAEIPDGIVCRACGGTAWRVIKTRLSVACVRRWRRCLGCRAVSRTAERLEAGPHPDHDAR